MNTEKQQADGALGASENSEQLGPLPKARYWMTNASAYSIERSENVRGTVPVHRARSREAKNGLFTSAQMHEYAAEQMAAERERCAKVCEAEHVLDRLDSDEGHPCDLAYNRALQDAAAAIRGA